MNPQLPPLPEPLPLVDRKISYYGGDNSGHDVFSPAQMTAYGLQCAEAERARCLLEVNGMIEECKQHPGSHTDYAAFLLAHIARRIERK